MKELRFKPTEVKDLIFIDEQIISNYTYVSIEEMDYMMELAIKYQQLHENWFNGVENNEPTIIFLRKCKEVFEGTKPDSRKVMK